MNYVGIDIHKKYSVLSAQDERGGRLKEARIEGNCRQDYARFFGALAGPSKAVLEACWNWGLTHDLLEEIEEVEEVVLAHPLKTRLIADAQIKTDRLDAFALGTLLPEPDGSLLQEALALHALIAQQMKAQEKRIAAEFKLDSSYERLLSLPGVGPTLGAVLAAEIDQVERFPSANKLCGYAGVVPTTHSSGGKVHHGRLLPYCNKWLRWALIEASWVAIGCSPYFGALYRQQRARGKKANTAITIVARRMCRIPYQLLAQQRSFEKRPPRVQITHVPGCSA